MSTWRGRRTAARGEHRSTDRVERGVERRPVLLEERRAGAVGDLACTIAETDGDRAEAVVRGDHLLPVPDARGRADPHEELAHLLRRHPGAFDLRRAASVGG